MVVEECFFFNMGLWQYGFWQYEFVAIRVLEKLDCGNILGFSNMGLWNYGFWQYEVGAIWVLTKCGCGNTFLGILGCGYNVFWQYGVVAMGGLGNIGFFAILGCGNLIFFCNIGLWQYGFRQYWVVAIWI